MIILNFKTFVAISMYAFKKIEGYSSARREKGKDNYVNVKTLVENYWICVSLEQSHLTLSIMLGIALSCHSLKCV